MRFMIIVPGGPETESASPGTEEQYADMQTYQDEMLRAGVHVDGQGLHPTSKGALVTWENDEWVVTDGPFAESKEIIAGFSIIEVSSREEAIEWVKMAAVRRAEPWPGPGAAPDLLGGGLRRAAEPGAEAPRGRTEAAAKQAAQG